MPSAVGACFLPVSFVSIWLLSRLPDPDEADVAARIEREPMDGSQRASFVLRYLFGLALVFLVYFFITAFRDFRDNYSQEIFRALGYGDEPGIFSKSEVPVTFGVGFALAMLNLIKDNRHGLVGAFAIMACGTVLLGGGTLLFDAGLISGLAWMILTGLGGFLTYVPFGSVLFDRMIASTRTIGTAVFAIYVADAIGYTGSIGLMLYKDLYQPEMPRLEFFRGLTYFMSLFGTACLFLSCLYFWRKTRPREP